VPIPLAVKAARDQASWASAGTFSPASAGSSGATWLLQ
jgi:hypothetical protein